MHAINASPKTLFCGQRKRARGNGAGEGGGNEESERTFASAARRSPPGPLPPPQQHRLTPAAAAAWAEALQGGKRKSTTSARRATGLQRCLQFGRVKVSRHQGGKQTEAGSLLCSLTGWQVNFPGLLQLQVLVGACGVAGARTRKSQKTIIYKSNSHHNHTQRLWAEISRQNVSARTRTG